MISIANGLDPDQDCQTNVEPDLDPTDGILERFFEKSTEDRKACNFTQHAKSQLFP